MNLTRGVIGELYGKRGGHIRFRAYPPKDTWNLKRAPSQSSKPLCGFISHIFLHLQEFPKSEALKTSQSCSDQSGIKPAETSHVAPPPNPSLVAAHMSAEPTEAEWLENMQPELRAPTLSLLSKLLTLAAGISSSLTTTSMPDTLQAFAPMRGRIQTLLREASGHIDVQDVGFHLGNRIKATYGDRALRITTVLLALINEVDQAENQTE